MPRRRRRRRLRAPDRTLTESNDGPPRGPFVFLKSPMHPRPSFLDNDTVAFACAAMLLVLALLFGGGPRGAGDAVVHVAMLPCLALGIVRWRLSEVTRWDRAFLGLLLAALGLVVVQLVPLPPAWFAALPHRASVATDLVRAGIATAWRPMTLDVWATVRAGLALVTFAATWLLARSLPPALRRRLLIVALGVGVAMAFLGFAQAAGGANALRFHAFHHPIGAIGTFANRNHFADLLGMLLPIALAFAAQAQRRGDRLRAGLAFATVVALWLAAALSFSRAGFLLASMALVVAAIVLWWPRRGAGQRWLAPALALGIAMLGVGHFAWDGLMRRLEADPLDDLRWQYLHYGLDAMWAWLPWGSGLGTFPWVYAPMEPLQAMGPSFAERAHDDFLQIAIEAGIPGLLLGLTFLIMIAMKAARNFPMGRASAVMDDPVRGVLAVSLAVPLLHSAVDYPLRTLALLVTAGLLLSIEGVRDQQAGA